MALSVSGLSGLEKQGQAVWGKPYGSTIPLPSTTISLAFYVSLVRYTYSSLLCFYGKEQEMYLLIWKLNKFAAKEQHELQVSQVSLGLAAIVSTWAQQHKTRLKKLYFPIVTGDSKET